MIDDEEINQEITWVGAQEEKIMSINKLLLYVAVLSATSSIAFASDVYIDQAGSSSTIDITQTGDSNTIGSTTTPTTFTGNSQDIDLVQTGNSNKIDINTSTGAASAIINYTATGDSNELVMGIAAENDFTGAVTGDNNIVTLCGTNDGAGTKSVGTTSGSTSTASTTGTASACSTDVTVADTTTVLAVTGDYNSVDLELGSANATNTITVGGTVASNFNDINLKQTGNDIPTVVMTVDGDSNAINVLQN